MPEDPTSYAIGYEAGEFILGQMREDSVRFDPDSVLTGLEDALREKAPRVERRRMRELLQELEEQVRAGLAGTLREDPVFAAAARRNLEKSRAYHERFGQERGVVTLPSGVQYRVIDEGEGASPTRLDRVVVSFEAGLIDGPEIADGDRVEIEVGSVMEGAQELLMRMREGGRVYGAIPPEHAFGLVGRAPDVGPNETVLVEVELHEVKRP
jgi:FKBP-type peptidyl-prolyl cis-trans isomerase FklB